MDAFGKLVGIVLFVAFLFIIPVTKYTQHNDSIMNNFVASETNKFVSTVRNTGVITADQYNEFIEVLDSTNHVYNVEITHSSLIVNPEYTTSVAAGGSTTNLTSEYYVNVYESTILKSLYETPEAEYIMSKGDYISVKVSNKSKTLGTKMLELVFGHSINTPQIVAIYGGVIKDEGI